VFNYKELPMTVHHICIRSVDNAQPDESVWAAAERMHQRGVGALVVVNRDEEPIGIVTDRDLMERVLVNRLDVDETTVQSVMTPKPRVVYEDATVDTALSLMRAGRCRRLPVVDHEGKLTGLVCLDDLVMKTARDMNAMGEIVKSETPCSIAEPLVH
jgi:CBS domain-containing protein